MSLHLREYRNLDEIRDRLAVLYAKADRITRYNETRDPSLLDEKQVGIMEAYGREPGERFPGDVRRTLGYTLDYLETKRYLLERRCAA